MLVLHGRWVRGTADAPPTFELWSGTDQPSRCPDVVRAAQILLALERAADPDPLGDGPGAGDVPLGDDLRAWISTTRLCLDLLRRRRVAPVPAGADRPDAEPVPRWRLLLDDPRDRAAVVTLSAALPAPALTDYLDRLADALASQAAPLAPTSSAPGQGAASFRLCFRLEAPGDSPAPAGEAPADTPWTLRFLLQATDDPSLLLPASQVWQERGPALRLLNRTLAIPQEYVIAGLGRSAAAFAPLEASLRRPRPEACHLSTAEAYAFVRDASARGAGTSVAGGWRVWTSGRARWRRAWKGARPSLAPYGSASSPCRTPSGRSS
jgi:hypothetical protein